MSNEVKISVAGFAEIEKELRDLPEKVQRKVVGTALRKGARVARRGLRRAAPVRGRGAVQKTRKGVSQRFGGFLKYHRRGIIVRKAKKGANRRGRIFIGPSYEAFYGQQVEEGHGPPSRKSGVVRRRSGGGRRGGARPTPAHPWMHRGWEPVKMQALDAVAEGFEDGIIKAYQPPRAPRKRRPRG